jgi:hypothetical protein
MSTETSTPEVAESTTPPRPSIADEPPKLKRCRRVAFGDDDVADPAPVVESEELYKEIDALVAEGRLSYFSLRQVLHYVADAPTVPLEPHSPEVRAGLVAQMVATAAQGAADFAKSEHGEALA